LLVNKKERKKERPEERKEEGGKERSTHLLPLPEKA
jgi:hypothetical protein